MRMEVSLDFEWRCCKESLPTCVCYSEMKEGRLVHLGANAIIDVRCAKRYSA